MDRELGAEWKHPDEQTSMFYFLTPGMQSCNEQNKWLKKQTGEASTGNYAFFSL